MARTCAAVLAALFLCLGLPRAGAAQDVALTSRDGSIELEGTLLGFDGEFYRLDTIYGELTLDSSGVLCDGPGCPNLEDFVAEVAISGADSMARVLLPALIEAFAARNGLGAARREIDARQIAYTLRDDSRVVARLTIRGSNTDEGFADLLADEADIAMATREIRPAEVRRAREAGLGQLDAVNRSRVLALDGLVAVVAPGHPVTDLSLDEISRVLAGRIDNWRDLGGPDAPIELHVPDARTGAAQAMEDLLLRPAGRTLREDVQRHATPDEIARAVSRDFLGLGIATYAARDPARVMTVTGTCGFAMRPSRRVIKTEDYPLTQPLFLYLPARRLPKLARDFLAFTRSAPAQIVIRRVGFVDQLPEEISIDAQGDRFVNAITVAGPEIPLATLQRMVRVLGPRARLTTSFRFEPGSSRLDAQSRSNVQQLARALERGTYDARDLLFVGFSDGQGPAEGNRVIAARRAEAVMRAVVEAAETANLVQITLGTEAFGEALPMACDDTAWGRGVNRRVEVWVR
jgi:phosphate transport system substrate-binding protein